MPFTFAGRYGPEIFEDENRQLLKSKPVAVYEAGTNVLGDLFTDRTKVAAAANPFTTDARGNGWFFAEPGEYELEYDGWRIPITVPLDFIEAMGGGPPTGQAGGDLLGSSYPDPVIAPLAVSTGKLANLGVTTGKLADGAVTTPKIGDGQVTAAKVAADVATQAELDAQIAGIIAQKGAANGIATLGADSKIPTAQLPPLSINETFTVVSEAAMLALAAQRGDVAIRTDLDPDGFFLLTSDSPGTLADWKQILAPGAVVSVNAQTGAVVIPTDAAAGTGSLRTLGVGAQQAAAGNDARLSDTRTPTDASVTAPKFATSLLRTHTVANAAARLALGGMRAGDLVYEQDTARFYRWYTGGVWTYQFGGTNPTAMRATVNNVTALANGAFTLMNWQVETFDYGNNFAAHRYTVPETGLYDVDSTVAIANINVVQRFVIAIFVNGALLSQGTDMTDRGAGVGDVVSSTVSDLQAFTAGDLVDIRAFQQNGAAVSLNTQSPSAQTFFSIVRH